MFVLNKCHVRCLVSTINHSQDSVATTPLTKWVSEYAPWKIKPS